MEFDLEDHVKGHRPCPRCGEDMWIVERRGQKLDTCARCKGLWFDSSELDSVLGSESRVELMISIKPSVRGERLMCPTCRSYMESKDVLGIFIDHCTRCNGIWLDQGETEKIWDMTEHIMHPFEDSGEGMDTGRFWYPFKRNQEELGN